MDYLSLKAAVSEAREVFAGIKITDAWQAGPGEVVVLVRRGPGMVLSTDPVRPGLFLEDRDLAPGRIPSPFTDLLRARIKGTTLGSIRLREPGERIVAITFAAAWPLKEGIPIEIVLEVMGRRSNLMLLEGGRILQPLRSVSKEKSPVRPVVAGELYRPPPPRAGIPVEDVTAEDLAGIGLLEEAGSLQDRIRGLSPYAASQALRGALHGTQKGDPGTVPDAGSVVTALMEMVASCTGEKGYLHRSGGKVHLSPFEPVTASGFDAVEVFTPFSNAAAAWRRSGSQAPGGAGIEKDHLEGNLRARLAQIDSALDHVDREEERCRAHDEIRGMAEALLIHAGEVKTGLSSVKVPDPYDPGIEMTIPLERNKTPQENVAGLFNRARRLKRGLDEVGTRRKNLELEKKELQLALKALVEMNDPEPAGKILDLTPPSMVTKGKARQYSQAGPGRRFMVDGFTILVGKSSTDNEKVTFKAAGPGDLWLHARDYPGSHVVILTQKKNVPDKVLYEAAALAAAGSGAKNEGAPEIMVTERKWVRKLKGGKPGQVTVERFRTIRPRIQNPESRNRDKY